MTTTHTGIGESEKPRHINPSVLLISIIRQVGGNYKHESQHKVAFKRLLADPGYEEFRDAVIDEWLGIKYTTALGAAHPPTAAQLKQNLDSRKAQDAEQRRAIDALKAKIRGRILQLVMPNGKKLAECTGAECIEFGGWYTAIGERVGAKNLVGKVLRERDILRLLARS
jgi:hypothetical protein